MLENAHDAVAGAWSRDDDDDGHLSTNDESRQTGVLTDPVMGIVRICSGPAYEMFKAGLVSYHCARMGYSDCRNHSQSLQLFTSKTLSTLSPKTATVAEKCDCRRFRPQIVAEIQIGAYSRQCGQALTSHHHHHHHIL